MRVTIEFIERSLRWPGHPAPNWGPEFSDPHPMEQLDAVAQSVHWPVRFQGLLRRGVAMSARSADEYQARSLCDTRLRFELDFLFGADDLLSIDFHVLT